MSIRKQIQESEWQDRFQSISSGNRGRISGIDLEGKAKALVGNKAFESINYDPVNKGNNFVISLDGFVHTVEAPAGFI